MTLQNRKNEIYSENGNITMCQIGCEFESFNKTTKKAKCRCEIQKNDIEINITKINFGAKDIGRSFLKTAKNPNFYVLKCYKLAFNYKDILKNKGRIIIMIIISFIILLLFYIIKDRTKVDMHIQCILENKYFIKDITTNKHHIKCKRRKNMNNNNDFKNDKKIAFSQKEINKITNIRNTNNIKNNQIFISSNNDLNYRENKNNNKIINDKAQVINKKNIINIYEMNKNKNIKTNKEIYENNNDLDMYSLKDEKSMISYKGTFFKYYCSILKNTKLILFTFLTITDYHLLSFKISLFLFSFSLYFSINNTTFTEYPFLIMML